MSRRSIENGAIPIYDADGQIRGQVGIQPDGTTAVTTVNDPIPPQPSAPIVFPTVGGLEVTWDGTFVGDAPRPSDFARVEIHASTQPTYTPGPLTRRAAIGAAGGVTLSLPPDAYYVCFVVYTTGSSRSDRSVYAAETPLALASEADIEDIRETATTALDTADGKNRVVYSTELPSASTPGTRAGDVWFRRTAQGVIVGSYEWSGTEWLLRKFGDATLDSLTVSKLTTGTLAAGVALTAGDPTADYAQLDSQGLRVFRADPAGGAPNEIVKLGERVGATNPATKRQTWNIDETGNAALRALSVTEDPLIMGRSLMGLINSTNARMVAYGQVDRPAYPGIGTGELGIMELAFRAETGRAYAIHFEGLNVAGNVANDDVVMYVRNNGANLPLTTSPIQAGPVFDQVGAANRFKHFGFDRFLMGYGGTNGALQRLIITVARGAGGSGQLQVVNCQPIAYVLDIGPNVVPTGVLNQGGAPPVGQPQNPPAVTLKDETHDALWTGSYNGAGNRRGDTSEAIQGYSSYDAGNGNQRSIIGFPDLTSRLAPASTNIELVEISFYANHWNDYDGGTAVIGHHGNASMPGTFNGTPSQLSVSGWARQQRRTINVTQWAAQIRSGAIRGFVLGPAPSNAGEYYGRFNGAGMAEPPRLRIRYTN